MPDRSNALHNRLPFRSDRLMEDFHGSELFCGVKFGLTEHSANGDDRHIRKVCPKAFYKGEAVFALQIQINERYRKSKMLRQLERLLSIKRKKNLSVPIQNFAGKLQKGNVSVDYENHSHDCNYSFMCCASLTSSNRRGKLARCVHR
jgi:hypothetical protein